MALIQEEIGKISYGTFKTMNLHHDLLKNISYSKTTPIQRKIIPLIIEGINVTGIARTGSGKTYAYLIPLINNILKNDEYTETDTNDNIINMKILILVPTRELVIQVYKVTQGLLKNTNIKVQSIFGGTSIEKDFSNMLDKKMDICIATVGRFRHCIDEMKKRIKTRYMVIDEVDRIYEEGAMRNDLDHLIGDDNRVSYSNFSLFSATLPEKVIPLVSQTRLIKIDAEMSESLTNYFFFITREHKEKSLILLLEKISNEKLSKKIIIFGSTRHTIEFLSDILTKIGMKHKMLYSSMDQQARVQNLDIFTRGKVNIIITTDLAARGLDIKDLDVCINYDMTDEKTFLHRVGRVARNGRSGESFSFISYKEINFFYNIRDTYVNRKEEMFLGLIPQELVDAKKIEIDETLKRVAENGVKKMESFRKKVRKIRFKENLLDLKVHPYFFDLMNSMNDKNSTQKNDIMMQIRKYKNINSINSDQIQKNIEYNEPNSIKPTVDYRDQFYIPYTNKESKGSLHYSAYSVPVDEKKIDEKERKKKEIGLLFKEWEKKKKKMNSGENKKRKIKPDEIKKKLKSKIKKKK